MGTLDKRSLSCRLQLTQRFQRLTCFAARRGLDFPSREGHYPFLPAPQSTADNYIPDVTRINAKYFDFVDFCVDEAAKRGILVMLVPTWGRYCRLIATISSTRAESFCSQLRLLPRRPHHLRRGKHQASRRVPRQKVPLQPLHPRWRLQPLLVAAPHHSSSQVRPRTRGSRQAQGSARRGLRSHHRVACCRSSRGLKAGSGWHQLRSFFHLPSCFVLDVQHASSGLIGLLSRV